MRLRGEVHIGQPHRGDGKRTVEIHVTDDASRVRFVVVECAYEEFVVALMQGTGACEIEVRGLEKLGTTREHKSEAVPWDMYVDRDRDPAEALAPFEVNGWRANRDDLKNGHRCVKGDPPRQTVAFERWVTTAQAAPAQARSEGEGGA